MISRMIIYGGSKTYCGYCKRVKDLLVQLGATYKVIEMDEQSKYELMSHASFSHTNFCFQNFFTDITTFLFLQTSY